MMRPRSMRGPASSINTDRPASSICSAIRQPTMPVPAMTMSASALLTMRVHLYCPQLERCTLLLVGGSQELRGKVPKTPRITGIDGIGSDSAPEIVWAPLDYLGFVAVLEIAAADALELRPCCEQNRGRRLLLRWCNQPTAELVL